MNGLWTGGAGRLVWLRGPLTGVLLGLAAGVAGARECRAAVPQDPAGVSEADPLGLGARELVTVRARMVPRARAPVAGGLVTVNLTLAIAEGWHVYANPVGDGTYRPTVVRLGRGVPARVLSVDYPRGKPLPGPSGDSEARAYAESAVISVRLQLAGDVPAGPLEIPLEVEYQACDDRLCRPPARLATAVRIEVAAP
jgi:DsbC/DsbD-like thiol-disulfide interchange protein